MLPCRVLRPSDAEIDLKLPLACGSLMRQLVTRHTTPLKTAMMAHWRATRNGSPVANLATHWNWMGQAIMSASLTIKPLDTEISETFSIVIWVKGTYRPNDWHGLVTKHRDGESICVTCCNGPANGKFEFALFGEGGNDSWTASDILPEDGTWYHVAAVYTGKEAQVYVDGVLSATRAFSAEIADTNAPVVIGTNYPNGIQPVDGLIDEAAIFSIALEEEDINAIMDDGLEETLGILAVEPSDKLALTWGDLKVGNDK